ncbi:DEAD/DEAH box helicase [Marinilabiliaceae bacterium JC017]|nr:DEAD/DEAH box helicase [Marinilabiliaceae bacterium JC017]
MNTFEELNIKKQLHNAIEDLGFDKPTPIQKEAYPVILSGKDVVGIAQTGTGKTFAYMLPILQQLTFSKQVHPRVLILVPTRELVLQVVENIESFAKYISVRVLGVYGGANINMQKQAVGQGTDILVATPGRLYDLALCKAVQLKAIKKLIIDEVDVMLDSGFRYQLTNIFDLIPARRQNIMFSATMTEEVDALIEDFFIAPARISIAVSGTPLDNIAQQCYRVANFNTKVNLLSHITRNKKEYSKVLVFVSNKKRADRLFEALEKTNGSKVSVIHSNKSQNYRIRSIQEFDQGVNRILVATDVMARGLDFDKISHVINFDTPDYPENYMHRIGRTGRAEEQGQSILFYTKKEEPAKKAIEDLMVYEIPRIDFPEEVEISTELIPEERPANLIIDPIVNVKIEAPTGAFHEKKEKNKKTNQGGSYLRKMKVYKKPKTRGDKNFNRRKKK